MKDTILVIEDDPSLLLGLRMNLEREGYRVRTAVDGHRGLAELARERPDLVVLDLMLPGVNGLEILRQIRAADRVLPVVVLTALAAEGDKVRGLDLGANDYVTKPFGIAELMARIRAALRVASGGGEEPDPVLRFGPLEVEKGTRNVRLRGEPLDLSAKEYDLLLYMAERPERVFTRTQILQAVWGSDYQGTERTVDNFVSSLRRKLGEDDRRGRHLRTVWGIGYRFVP